ncbi:uncharacterized protein N7483_010348 [Penicillium malachiteum]|uniref:uncharacterized protein n=1 Tax=Penicillium malachiteum TaxID=1324776 RepID=UPI0025485641|nr:uncharacterized protein N7483_010348 [Penicillium malachiteum]KAJ5713167.1 hypothetical protein N7483_010348 [Penicillium malachiteum]
MASNFPFKIRERISSLMSPGHRELIQTTRRRVVISISSHISVDSTASEFLSAKIQDFEDEEAYINQVKAGLEDVNLTKALSSAEYRKELNSLLRRFCENAETLKVLKRQRHNLTDDIDDSDALEKHQRVKGPLGANNV